MPLLILNSYCLVIANKPTIVTNKKFGDVHTYPNTATDYAYTFNAMKHIEFDLWVALYGIQFDLTEKDKRGSAYNPAAFKDKKNHYAQIDDL